MTNSSACSEKAPRGEIIVAMRDLLFGSQIKAWATEQQYSIVMIRDATSLRTALQRALPHPARARCVAVDLQLPENAGIELCALLASEYPAVPTVCFFPHVRTELPAQIPPRPNLIFSHRSKLLRSLSKVLQYPVPQHTVAECPAAQLPAAQGALPKDGSPWEGSAPPEQGSRSEEQPVARRTAIPSPRGSSSGVGKLTLLIFGSIIGSVVFVAYHVLPFYYYFYELKNQMRAAIVLASTATDQEIRRKLVDKIKWMEIPADPAKLLIERGNGVMKISLAYQEVFYVTFRGKDYDIQKFDFLAEEEGSF